MWGILKHFNVTTFKQENVPTFQRLTLLLSKYPGHQVTPSPSPPATPSPFFLSPGHQDSDILECSTPPFHDGDLFLGQAVKPVDDRVDEVIGELDTALYIFQLLSEFGQRCQVHPGS